MRKCEMFVCKYLLTCLVGVDCKNGVGRVCRTNLCDVCRLNKRCKNHRDSQHRTEINLKPL